MGKYLIISLLLVFSLRIYSQDYTLLGEISNLGESKVYLSAWQKGEFVSIDSTVSSRGSFHFIFPPSGHPGLYALHFEMDGILPEQGVSHSDMNDGKIEQEAPYLALEFIFSNENIEIFATDIRHIQPEEALVNSIENDMYYAFLKDQYTYTNDSIRQAWSEYTQAKKNGSPANEERLRFISMQENWDDYLVSTATRYQDLYVSHVIKANRFPIVDPDKGGWEILKHRFFELAPMDDALLLYHPQYINRIDDFLALYFPGSHSDSAAGDENYFNAIDIIMANVSHEPELRLFIVEYLLGLFDYYDSELLQVYVAENYLDEKCESDIVELVLTRMEGYKAMKPGNRAPDFVIKDSQNRTFRLSLMENKLVLVMFWASTCDHCQKMIPQLQEWYRTENSVDMEIVAISIDTTDAQWKAFMDAHNPDWISVFDPLGWYGKVPRDYNVYATPSLFLLDSKRKILAKPFTYREFLKALKKL